MIVVDDGSTRNKVLSYLPQLPKKYREYDLRIAHQENQGPGAARNKVRNRPFGMLCIFWSRNTLVMTVCSVQN
ncbi:MAG: hypothetical protein AAF696_26270 [Bacteroidota bacterium]